MVEPEFWNREIETAPAEKIREVQLEGLRRTVAAALRTRFYHRRLKEIGFTSPEDIRSLDDLKRIPFTTKSDLREAYPDGLLAVERDDVVRLHTSSGTTGTPTVIYHTRSDLEHWTELTARCITATGAGRRDVFQNMMTYGLFTGGLGLHYGAELVGMLVIPVGGGNTRRQLKLMRDFRTTVVHATPSYMLHIYSRLEAENLTPQDLSLRKAFLGAEAYSESTRRKIEGLMGIDCYNSYGLSEMNGPGVAFECIFKDDMHVWEDAYIVEVIDPASGDLLGEDEEGELVMTTLQREATPLLRYRTGDLTRIRSGVCACGRSHRRIARIKGRSDDMLIINGVNVYPSQVESVLMRIPEVGTNYQIVVTKEGALDRLTVKTEIYSKMFTGDAAALEALRGRIRELLKAEILVGAVVELHEPGGLPVYEGKARRVFDERVGEQG